MVLSADRTCRSGWGWCPMVSVATSSGGSRLLVVSGVVISMDGKVVGKVEYSDASARKMAEAWTTRAGE